MDKVSGAVPEGLLRTVDKQELEFTGRNEKVILLDCGCSEGDLTIKVANKIRAAGQRVSSIASRHLCDL